MDGSGMPVVSVAGVNVSPISDKAADAIRFRFNPSGLDNVGRIKALTGTLITMMEELEVANPACGYEAAVAITKLQTASMWAVLAATKGL